MRPEVAAELAAHCVYIEQGRSGKTGARKRPLFEQMKLDAAQRKFDRLLVWKVSRLGRDMREVISTVYELADLGVTVVPIKSQTSGLEVSGDRLRIYPPDNVVAGLGAGDCHSPVGGLHHRYKRRAA